MRKSFLEKQYSIITGKLHALCPHREETNVKVRVVIKDGSCYRSRYCSAMNCRYNPEQDVERLPAVTCS